MADAFRVAEDELIWLGNVDMNPFVKAVLISSWLRNRNESRTNLLWDMLRLVLKSLVSQTIGIC